MPTVKQLIEELAKLPQDHEVRFESVHNVGIRHFAKKAEKAMNVAEETVLAEQGD